MKFLALILRNQISWFPQRRLKILRRNHRHIEKLRECGMVMRIFRGDLGHVPSCVQGYNGGIMRL